jgi:hypothetical protein
LKPLLPHGEWVNPEAEAKRWDLPTPLVETMMEQVSAEKELEIELKVRRRALELLDYLRVSHDREVQKRTCSWDSCNAGPWDTWGDMAAHVRVHLVLDSGDAAVTARVLNDAEKLVHPETAIEVKVKATEADRAELLRRVSDGLVRQLHEKK